jgi:general secretion pathway protein D
VADLEKVFGENSKTPSAGMFRFMPLEGSNAVMVITPQASYLDQIQDWLERIDNAGDTPRLFSYELKYIKARDLAQRLSEVFGGGSGRSSQSPETSLVPGSVAGALNSDPFASSQSGGRDGSGMGNSSSFDSSGGLSSGGSDSSSGGLGSSGNNVQLGQRQEGNGAVTLEVEGNKVGVAAVEETNSLLIRASGNAWRSIKDVIEKLDVMPMQVHIEAQVAEVNLTGELSYGVNWYFEQSVNAPLTGATSVIGNGAGLPSAAGRNIWGDIAGTVGGSGVGWTFLGKNAAAVISALDTVTNVRILQSPSVFVRNNALAQLKVGQQIPINSTSVNTGIGTDTAYTSVQYKDTGVILNVRPRVTKDGTVFMEIAQEVSTPGAAPANCDTTTSSCNPPINTRFVKTEAAIQSGDTIMLAGLINDQVNDGSSGVPFLSRLPWVGALFGQKTQNTTRNEVIVLLTPTIVRNPQEARNLTDEYSQRFRAMEPLKPSQGK